jgi:hypothetical protein
MEWDIMGRYGRQREKREKSWCCRELTGVNLSSYPQPGRQPVGAPPIALTPQGVAEPPDFATCSGSEVSYQQPSVWNPKEVIPWMRG